MIEVKPILDQLNIDYQDKGSYFKFKCINPSHDDKHPSMTMLKDSGFCKCWSCGATYSLASFIKEMSGESFYEFLSIKNVKDYKFKSSLTSSKKFPKRKEVRKLIIQEGSLLPVYHNEYAMDYLKSIDVDKETIDFFDIQYTKRAKIKFYSSMKETYFSNRICVPVKENNRIVNLEGRDFTLMQTPKVLYPRGGLSDTLFNLENIDKNRSVVVVEGMKSLFRIWKYFNKNVVSTFGSAFGERQKELLKSLPHVILFPDNDDAGYKMLENFENFYDKEYQIVFMKKSGYDPADGSLQDLQDALTHPVDSVTYFLNEYEILPQRTTSWVF